MRQTIDKAPVNLVRRITLYILLASAPAILAFGLWIWTTDYSVRAKVSISLPIVLFWLGYASAARLLLERHLQTLANVLSSLREGDYSLRARAAGHDALAELSKEANLLADTLQRQRRSETEATHLLTTVLEEVDAAIFAFDADGRLRLANPHGLLLLGSPSPGPFGRSAADVGLAECLSGQPVRIVSLPFRREQERWGLRRSVFFSDGRPHTLLLLADLSQTLREQELVAWQRIVRVLTHELNNSLAPIKSITGSLQTALRAPDPAPDWREDFSQGLAIIASRAEGLQRFTESYGRLARLPEPRMQETDLRALLHRIQQMDTMVRPRLALPEGLPALRLDPALIEQALINLVKNAAEAASSDPGAEPPEVVISASSAPGAVRITIRDNGPGIGSSTHLFVPFYSTKPGGSGIGLVLARQIIERHNGTLQLENASPRGCAAILTLPA